MSPSIVIPKKIAVVSVGLPGVGKSTILKALNQKIANSVILDKDTISLSLLQGYSYASDYYNKYVKIQSYELLLTLAKDNLKSDRVVFLDGFFGDKLRWPLVSSFFSSEDFELKVLFFYCSFHVNKNRIEERRDPRDEEKINNFNEYYANVFPAHQKELEKVAHLPINTEQPISNNIDEILRYLS